MTVKEQLHELVDELDESGAQIALSYLTQLATRDLRHSEAGDRVVDEDDELITTGLITQHDPLGTIVGIIDVEDNGSTDVSSNKHRYLAEYYRDFHNT